jgi:hypothetical protein
MQVFGALSAHGLEQAERFEELGLGEAALALAQAQIGLGQRRHPQRPEGAREAQSAGAGAGRLVQRARVQDEGRLAEQGQAGGHGLNIENL